MKMFIRSSLVVAAGLVALSLPAHAQRPYDPSAGSVGFKRTTTQQQQLAQRPYDPSAGSVGFKKAKKKKKAKK